MPTTDRVAIPLPVRLLVPVGAAVVVTVVSRVYPLVGPLLLALVLGALVANSALARSRFVDGQDGVTKLLLRLGVVLVGLKLPLGDIASIGWRGAVVVGVTVAVTFSLTRSVGRRMGLDRSFVTCLAAGFSVCGAAAIAAVSDAVRARQRDVAVSVAMVTIYGSAMILFVPWASRAAGLTDFQAAVWAGASIHEVAQVVAAAALVGSASVAVATTVKLGRVATLALVYLASASRSERERHHTPVLPWFLVGFMIMVAVRTVGIVPAPGLRVVDVATTLLLAAGMFGLGLGFRLRDLWPIPRRVVALATLSTIIAGTTSLSLVVWLI